MLTGDKEEIAVNIAGKSMQDLYFVNSPPLSLSLSFSISHRHAYTVKDSLRLSSSDSTSISPTLNLCTTALFNILPAVACNLLLPVAYMDHIVVNKNTCPTGESMLSLLSRESEV